MVDILIQPAANAEDDLTGSFVIDDAALPLANQDPASFGMSLDTLYRARVLGTGAEFEISTPATYLDAVSVNIGGSGIAAGDSLGWHAAQNWFNADFTEPWVIGGSGYAGLLMSSGGASGAEIHANFYSSGNKDTLTSLEVADDGTPEWDLMKVGGQMGFGTSTIDIVTPPTGFATYDFAMIFDGWRTDQAGSTIEVTDGTTVKTFTCPSANLYNGGDLVEGVNVFVWRGLSGAKTFEIQNANTTFAATGIQILKVS